MTNATPRSHEPTPYDDNDPLDFLSNLGEDVCAAQQALFSHPEMKGWLERTPGLGHEIPWTIASFTDETGRRISGLVVAGNFTNGKWDLTTEFVLFTGRARRPGTFLSVDGSVVSVRPQGSVPGVGPRRPDCMTLLKEVQAASMAWAAQPSLRARWAVFAATHGCSAVPNTFVELRFQDQCYRGLLVDGTLDSTGLWDMEQPVALLLPTGRTVELLADQADSVTFLTGGEHYDLKRFG
ncbi:hypothetical protein OQ496_13360 [Acetobacter suratthaniensis]|uniref:Uncharacterized protein n=1 Tax=Acetobacter suratthaniensis TaxID=1502841 RepID=A0ABS3LPW7_9PROT|nr:hypothetical protein [Acetobacter suratthaniensis]MBO1329405.1 hypothetical protein [Acetobacter suratthaniensis]MCX2567435.1 hypothetical protein [Acetobacter suratthaniensis]